MTAVTRPTSGRGGMPRQVAECGGTVQRSRRSVDGVHGGNPNLRTVPEDRGTGHVLAAAC